MYVYTTGNGTPTRGEEWFVHSFVLTKAILQPVKAATMCIACLLQQFMYHIMWCMSYKFLDLLLISMVLQSQNIWTSLAVQDDRGGILYFTYSSK